MEFFYSLISVLKQVVHSIHKFILHKWSGRCEIARICGDKSKMHTAEMTKNFASSLRHSKQLVLFSKDVFGSQTFSVTSISFNIMIAKCIPVHTSLLTVNIRNCLEHLNFINRAVIHMSNLKKEKFSDSNPQHVQMLEELWSNLRPCIQRKGGRITAEWGEIGFQGKDPATDFRGMGMLSLAQLVYFSKMLPELAINLLQQSQHDAKYFPFAATGINITAFVMELLLETRLHAVMVKDLDKILLQNTGGSSGAADDNSVQATVNLVHHIYSTLFLRMGRNWMNAKTVDLMDFPVVFNAFKTEVRLLYPPL